MIEVRIDKTTPLPDQSNLQRIAKRKEQAIALSERFRRCDMLKYADRLEQCADYMVLYKFQNGFRRVKQIHCCRVMGCPLCEEAKARKLVAGLNKLLHQQKGRLNYWRGVEFPLPPVAVSGIRKMFLEQRKVLHNTIRRKPFQKIKGYICTTRLEVKDDVAYPFFRFYAVGAIGGGNGYVKNETFSEEWGQEVTGIGSFNLNRNESRRLVTSIWEDLHVNLSLIEDKHLKTVVEQLLRLKSYRRSGVLSKFPEPEKRKPLYPSQVARRGETRSYAYLPNPTHPEHADEFLELEGLPWLVEEQQECEFSEECKRVPIVDQLSMFAS